MTADSSETTDLPSVDDEGPLPVDVTQRALPDVISEVLRRDISEGLYRPDEAIKIRPLAARFGVSTMPVREALRRLEAEGLVEFDKNRRISVKALSERDAREVFILRADLEPMAIREAIPALQGDEEGLAHLERIIVRMDKANEGAENDSWRLLNEEFHMRIYHAAEMPRLETIVRSLWSATDPYTRRFRRTAAHRRKANDQHAQMVELIRAGKAKEAADLMRDHINYSSESMTSDIFEGDGADD
jgi:DNA-binding GntR family transcriptional regulator